MKTNRFLVICTNFYHVCPYNIIQQLILGAVITYVTNRRHLDPYQTQRLYTVFLNYIL